jgi:hypothetical protein
MLANSCSHFISFSAKAVLRSVVEHTKNADGFTIDDDRRTGIKANTRFAAYSRAVSAPWVLANVVDDQSWPAQRARDREEHVGHQLEPLRAGVGDDSALAPVEQADQGIRQVETIGCQAHQTGEGFFPDEYLAGRKYRS